MSWNIRSRNGGVSEGHSKSAPARCLICDDTLGEEGKNCKKISLASFASLTKLLGVPLLNTNLDRTVLHGKVVICSSCSKISQKFQDLVCQATKIQQNLTEIQTISQQKILRSLENHASSTADVETKRAREIICSNLNRKIYGTTFTALGLSSEDRPVLVSGLMNSASHVLQEFSYSDFNDALTLPCDLNDSDERQDPVEDRIQESIENELTPGGPQTLPTAEKTGATNSKKKRPVCSKILSMPQPESRNLRKRTRISYAERSQSLQDLQAQKVQTVSRARNLVVQRQICPGNGYPCPECSRNFKSKSKLAEHRGIHAQSFFCQACNKSLPSNAQLRAHLKWHSGKGGLKCSKCDVVLLNRSRLNSHLHSHTKLELGSRCKVCKMNIRSKGQLAAHQKFHQGTGGFKCSIADCTEAFLDKRDFIRHTYTVHMNIHSSKTRNNPAYRAQLTKMVNDALKEDRLPMLIAAGAQ